MKLIVGLGNPGKEYEKTRHNVGFLLLDTLQKKLKDDGCSAWEKSTKFNAYVCGGVFHGQSYLLVKPLTFMNKSGEAVALIARYYKITPEDILIVHDDKDIQLSEIRLQKSRGHAGHNGVRSIFEHLSTQDITRLRVGISHGEPTTSIDTADFVLGKLGLFERRMLADVIEKGIDTILTSFLKTH